MKKIRFFAPKSILIFIFVAISFHLLWKYRLNDPLTEGNTVKNFQFTTLDGQNFTLKEYSIPVCIAFINTKTLFTTAIYPNAYLKRMPELIALKNKGYIDLIVILDVDQNPEEIRKIVATKKYKVLENLVYIGNIDELSEYFGVRSWPHFFMLGPDKQILYQSKIPAIRVILRILKGE